MIQMLEDLRKGGRERKPDSQIRDPVDWSREARSDPEEDVVEED